MNLFINVFLTPDSLGNGYLRGQLPMDDKVDIFKFMLNSLAVIPYWTNVYIYCKLDEPFKHRQKEIEDYVNKYFTRNLCILKFDRNETIREWKKAMQEVINYGHEITYFCNNHDHIFIGQLDTIDSIQEELSKKTDKKWRQVYSTHWPQVIPGAYFGTDNLVSDGYYKIYDEGFISFLHASSDGIQFVTQDVLYHWFFECNYPPDLKFGRLDGMLRLTAHKDIKNHTETLVPFEECFRHYEGYNMVGICPAMTIPPHFFDPDYPKVIMYGHDKTYIDFVNINPKKQSYRDIDCLYGTDYKNYLSEIPELFRFNNYSVNGIFPTDDLDKTARIEDNKRILLHGLNKMNWEHGFNKYIDLELVDRIASYAFTK